MVNTNGIRSIYAAATTTEILIGNPWQHIRRAYDSNASAGPTAMSASRITPAHA